MNPFAKLPCHFRFFDFRKPAAHHGSRLRIERAVSSVVERLESRQLLSSVVVNSLLDNTNDSNVTGASITLREAVNFENANGGGAISFAPNVTGSIKLADGELPITTSMTIGGPGPGSMSIDAAGLSRIFDIFANDNAASQVTVSGLTLTNGHTAAGSSVQAPGFGGAIYNTEQLTLSGDVISASTASTAGGAVASTGPLTVTGSQITNDSVYASGTITALAEGGGIYSTAALNVASSSLTNNVASAIQTAYVGSTAGATSTAAGGGIYSTRGPVVVTNSTIAANVAISSASASLAAGAYGAGVYADSSLAIVGDSITNNVASLGGGQEVGAFGGGIFSGNFLKTAPTTASLTILQSTIVINAANDNTDATSSGGGVDALGSISIGNSILAQDGTGGDYLAYDLANAQPVQSLGFNLIGQSAASNGWVTSDQVGTPASPLDPMVGALTSNGGPNQTLALLPGSPALAAGNTALAVNQLGQPLSTDQRGLARVVNGAVDIGAFETQAYAAPVSAGAATVTVSSPNPVANFGLPLTFTAAVNSASGTPTGSVQFLVNGVPAGGPVAISSGSASTVVKLLTANVYSVVAIYSGDSAFSAASSISYSQTVAYNPSVPTPVGTYSLTGFDDSSTQYAPPGTTVNSTQATQAMRTPVSDYASGFGNVSATAAPSGYFSSATGAVLPSPDPVGTYSITMGDSGNVTPTPASSGTYIPRIASSAATLTSAGFYDPGSSNFSQIPDPTGITSGNAAQLPTVVLTAGTPLADSELAGITYGYPGSFTFGAAAGTLLPVAANPYAETVTYNATNPTLYAPVVTTINVAVSSLPITQATPASVSVAGGMNVTLTGSGFAAEDKVLVDGLALATAPVSISPTTLVFTMPALDTLALVAPRQDPLVATITVKDPSGNLSNPLTVNYNPPVISNIYVGSLSGNTALFNGGQVVTVGGLGLSLAAGGTIVLNAGGTTITPLDLSASSSGDTQITFLTPSFVPELTGLPIGTTSLPVTVTFQYGTGNNAVVSNGGTFTVSAGSLVVTTTDDNINPTGYLSGDNSLRDAIAYADSTGGGTISFAGNLAGRNINLSGSQLELTATTNPVIIDASSIGGISISGNSASRVFRVDSGATVALNGLTLINGVANNDNGGGIYNAGTLTATNDTIDNNSASSSGGGGIYNAGTLTVTNDTIAGNSATEGGGICNDYSATLTAANNTIVSNSASNDAGGISNAGTLTVTNDTIAGNSAGHFGGGIASIGGLTSTNDTFVNNSAGLLGGGIENYGTMTLTNDTVVNNSAGDGGGIWNDVERGRGSNALTPVPLTVANTLVVGNSSPGSPDLSGTVINQGGNLIGLPTSYMLGQIIAVDSNGKPLLANNGGPTQTIALVAGSPAIGAGVAINGITTDQRGVARPATRPDIGAFQATFITVTSVSVSSSNLNSSVANIGDTVSFSIMLSGSFAVTGAPALTLSNGMILTHPLVLGRTLLFRFTVAAGEDTPALNATALNAVGISPTSADYVNTSGFAGTTDGSSVQIITVPTITVTDNGGVYKGSPFAATGTTSIGAPYYEYFLQSDTTFSHPSITAPTNVGTYVVIGFSPANSSYVQVGQAKYFSITPAPTIVTAADTGGVYNGSSIGATGTVTGAGGLSATPTFSYVGVGSTVYSSTTAPTNAGTYTVTANYLGDANHTANSSSAVGFTIAQATPTISVSDTGGVYNGSPFAATGTTSIGAPYYEYFLASDTAFKSPSTTAPTNVGSYVVIGFSPVNSNYVQMGQAGYFSITQAASVLAPVATTVAYGGSTTLSTTLKTTGGALLAGRTVTFSVNGKVIGTAVTNSSGVASLADSVAGITPGVYASGISVNFAGDSNSTATSATASLTVLDAPIVSSVGVSNLLSVASVAGSFTQTRTGAAASDFVATVNWGDGNTQQLLVVADLLHPGQFDLVGLSHIYLQLNQKFTLTVTISTVGKFGAVAGNTASYVTTIIA